MKKVLKGSIISVLVVLLITIEMMMLSYTARFVSYLNRGFTAKQAFEWTDRDMRIKDNTIEEDEHWIPMANANISWNSLGREP